MGHKLIKAALAAFVFFVTSFAHAGILYNWSGDCVSRIFNSRDGSVTLDFGCSAPVSGTFETHDGYVPGTSYSTGNGTPSEQQLLLVFDERGTIRGELVFLDLRDFTLPVTSGTAEWNLLWGAGNSTLSGGDLSVLTAHFANGVNGDLQIRAENIVVTRAASPVSAPGPVLLLLGPLAWFVSRRR